MEYEKWRIAMETASVSDFSNPDYQVIESEWVILNADKRHDCSMCANGTRATWSIYVHSVTHEHKVVETLLYLCEYHCDVLFSSMKVGEIAATRGNA